MGGGGGGVGTRDTEPYMCVIPSRQGLRVSSNCQSILYHSFLAPGKPGRPEAAKITSGKAGSATVGFFH